MDAQLIDALAAGATVITANRRLARWLQGEYDAAQAANGRKAWRAARIAPWEAWLRNAWEDQPESGATALVLSAAQEQALWEETIAAAAPPDAAVDLPALAREAASACRLLHAWRLAIPDTAWQAHEDTEAFWGWSREFRRRCAEDGWLAEAELPEALRANGVSAFGAPGQVRLAGFLETTPAQQALWDEMRRAGWRIEEWAPVAPGSRREARAGFEDAMEEFLGAARWARAQIESGIDDGIGVVVADLEAQRACLERIFADTFDPAAELPGAARRAPAFDFSLGAPLAESPPVSAALDILEAGAGEFDIAATVNLLRSPYLAGGDAEFSARAQLEAEIRSGHEWSLSLARLEKWARRPAPKLAVALGRLRRELAPPDASLGPADWAHRFSRELQASGWPGDRALASDEYQSLGAWHKLLDAFTQLEAVLPPIPRRAALGKLRRLAAEQIFQPETGLAPVRILGPLEASGLPFTRLWVAGWHAGNWPPPPRPHPFLPLAIQRERGLPHVSPARELDFARRVTERLRVSAEEIVFSWPRRDGDAELCPSPLLAVLPEIAGTALAGAGAQGYAAGLAGQAPLESFEDPAAPPLAPDTAVAGGVNILREQAACPFRAFAHVRLRAEELAQPAPGLGASERGRLLHAALARLFQALADELAAGRGLPTGGAREQTVDRAARMAIAEANMPALRPMRLAELERQRLVRMLGQWLEQESARPPFVIAALEEKRTVTIGGLQIEVRVDRVDRLPGAGELLIDYKSTLPSVNRWEGARPDEPQLPLYAVTREPPPTAVAWAGLAPGDMKFAGCGCVSAPGIRKPMPAVGWRQRLGEWRQALEALAAEFLNGCATVSPKHGAETCEHCDLPAFCRIAERAADEVAEDAPEGDASDAG